MQKVKMSLIAAGVLLAMAGSAQAGLLGQTVDSQYYAYGSTYNGFGSPASFVADGTVQSTFCAGCIEGYNLTVSDNQITYQFLTDNGYWSASGASLNSNGLFIANGNLLTFNGTTITSVTVDGATNMPGFDSTKLTFNDHNVAVDWADLTGIHAGDKVVLDVNVVPEPETYALMLAGLAVVGAVARRRRA